MSRDDYVGIIKYRNKYEGYRLSASNYVDNTRFIRKTYKLLFKVATVKEAIIKAQHDGAEYGYHFLNAEKI